MGSLEGFQLEVDSLGEIVIDSDDQTNKEDCETDTITALIMSVGVDFAWEFSEEKLISVGWECADILMSDSIDEFSSWVMSELLCLNSTSYVWIQLCLNSESYVWVQLCPNSMSYVWSQASIFYQLNW